ncbi:hypothetical protein E8E13_009495 [Curvularia kusanoi]|uniref:DUF7708 domain-containing protein n=1 Tax=Curvularia kusanoi TaxID=90978 RepID=A0A9P4WCF8_CURKU|nr:hypothetical protein E8E13_009495 [Curvularia kusanoi]
MSVQTDIVSSYQQQDEGMALVRRFTDKLEGASTLERATKSAQQHHDETEAEIRRRSLKELYWGDDYYTNDDGFHEMEAARLKLETALKEIEQAEAKPSGRAKLGLTRKPPRTTANKALADLRVRDLAGLKTVVESFESDWKDEQTIIGQRFRGICQKLDNYKGVFSIFPSQDMYTSALCGSVALIIHAAVNYNDFAETLSGMVLSITDSATRAAKILAIYRTQSFRELFSNLYAQIFLFYRDAIVWYAKPSIAKAFDSFNSNLVKPYEKASASIESLLTEIYREADVAHFAQTAVLAEGFEDGLRQQRDRVIGQDDLIFAGRQGQRLLLLMHKGAYLDEAPTQLKANRLIEALNEDFADGSDNLLGRAATKGLSEQLKPFVVGTEGPSLLKNGKFWLPDTGVSIKLGNWMSPDIDLSTLWISSPAAPRGTSGSISGSHAAALVALVAAWDSKMPIISHFFGLIGLVYSLIIQLLQFNVKDDKFGISESAFQKLDGSVESCCSDASSTV